MKKILIIQSCGGVAFSFIPSDKPQTVEDALADDLVNAGYAIAYQDEKSNDGEGSSAGMAPEGQTTALEGETKPAEGETPPTEPATPEGENAPEDNGETKTETKAASKSKAKA